MDRDSQTRLRLCTKCGYLLSGLPEDEKCPECNSSSSASAIPSLLPGRLGRLSAGSRLIAISYAALCLLAALRTFEVYYFGDIYFWLLDSYPSYEPQLYRVYEFFQYKLPMIAAYFALLAAPVWLVGWLTCLSRKKHTADPGSEDESLLFFKLAVWSLATMGFFYSLILGVFFAEKLMLFTVFTLTAAYFIYCSSGWYLKVASCVPDSKLARAIKQYRLLNYCALAISVGCVATLLIAAANPNPALANGIMYHTGPPLTQYDIAANWAYRVLYLLPVFIFAHNLYTTLRIIKHFRFVHKATVAVNA
ncbi:MAG: hypothetical protein Phyf2KO_26880 [Phycisphaerales bacterium]